MTSQMIQPQSTAKQKHIQTIKPQLSLHPSSIKGVLARVNLGSPSKNCLGVGICSIYLLSSFKEEETFLLPCSTIAILENHKGDRLSLHFKKDSLSSRAKESHFHEHLFTVEENYSLPTSLVKFLKCQPTIFKGFYPVKETKKFLTVYF